MRSPRALLLAAVVLALLVAPLVGPPVAVAVQAALVGDTHTSASSVNSNFGTATSLKVQAAFRTWLQFGLSTVPPTTTGDEVAKATLKIFVNTLTTAGQVAVHRVNGPWAESTLKHSNAPGTTVLGLAQVISSDDYVLVDVTNLVRDWIDAPATNFGLALVAHGASFAIDSKESGAHDPVLEIALAGSGVAGPPGSTGPAGPQGPAGPASPIFFSSSWFAQGFNGGSFVAPTTASASNAFCFLTNVETFGNTGGRCAMFPSGSVWWIAAYSYSNPGATSCGGSCYTFANP